MKIGSLRGKVDFGIITIREDEFRAVLQRFVPEESVEGERHYSVSRIQSTVGRQYLAVTVRCPEQGEGEAQDVARDLIEDLNPQWLLLVGIAGAVPDYEYTLGDVIAAMRLQDFCVGAALENRPPEYASSGGPMHKAVQDLLAFLPAVEARLRGWNDEVSIGMIKPPVELLPTNFYGDEQWQKKVQKTLERHYGPLSKPRPPLFTTGAIASSDWLIKDSETIKAWQKSARHIRAVEMELAGVYKAARRKKREYPILAIRGISDIVGFDRDPAWTAYACHSAAAFAYALIRSGLVSPRAIQGRAKSASLPSTQMPPLQPQTIESSEDDIVRRGLIGAFCTSVREPVTNIHKPAGDSGKHQKIYLEAIKRCFVESSQKEGKIRDESGGLWLNGEKLCGAVYAEQNQSPYDSLNLSLWRYISTFARGLAEANSTFGRNRSEDLMINGAFFVGNMVEEFLADGSSLYKGVALNASSQLEGRAGANTIIVGFIIPNGSSGGDLFNSLARSPVINAGELREYIYDFPITSDVGCDILLDVVPDGDQELLRFTGWRSRKDLLELDNYRIWTTSFKLIPKKERGFHVSNKKNGRWERREVVLPLSERIDHWELHELLDKANLESLDFVKQIYNKGEVKFFVSGENGASIELRSTRKVDRPRISNAPKKVSAVNFSQQLYCILPTNTHAVSGGANILIQTYLKDSNNALCFSKVTDEVLASYDTCEDFLDSAVPAIEFIFK